MNGYQLNITKLIAVCGGFSISALLILKGEPTAGAGLAGAIVGYVLKNGIDLIFPVALQSEGKRRG